MRRTLLGLCTLLYLPVLSFAGKTIDVTEVGKPEFTADFPSGGEVRMHIRSGDLRIVGTDDPQLKVKYEGSRADDIRDVKVSLRSSGNVGELRVSGGPRNDFQIEISVPRNTGLYLRMPAGDLHIENVVGDKDVELHAGDLNISVGDPKDYADVDCSVTAGDIEAGPFNVSKGGLFRHFHQTGAGKYHLHVHAAAGDLNLLP